MGSIHPALACGHQLMEKKEIRLMVSLKVYGTNDMIKGCRTAGGTRDGALYIRCKF